MNVILHFFNNLSIKNINELENYSSNMIAIIDYGMGNVGSVTNAVNALGYEVIIPKTKNDFHDASHIILPGVGAFAEGMKNLQKLGFIEILNYEVIQNHKPFLGLCMGMQLLAESGDEGGTTTGLSWIKGCVKKLSVDEKQFKIPHVGWNDIVPRDNSILFKNVTSPIFYFVHSYHFLVEEKSSIAAESEYGKKFVAAIEKNNIFGLQFHTEKSQREGLKVLGNFLLTSN
ncbi:MAG: Imidazole glycerol phosphate synthase subunit HisH [Nitrosopumilales archaeon]|nr:MAG: Imidazole glycerol phosphate synthase subunit HisH [Nitrosopumilales archaeon]